MVLEIYAYSQYQLTFSMYCGGKAGEDSATV